MPKVNKRARTWAFTLQNPSKTDLKYLEEFKRLQGIEYVLFQREKAPATGTIHLQGVIKFDSKKRWSKLKKFFSWCEPAKKVASLIAYCSKGKTRVAGHLPCEWGVPPCQGKRSDIQDGIELMKSNPKATWTELGLGNSAIPKYMTFFQKVKLESMPKRDFRCKGVWLFGEPDMGKSYAARHGKYYEKPPSKWFDDYQGEKRIVIDDLKGGITVSQLKRWCDCYPCKGEVKGGYIQLLCSELFVTSNDPPWIRFPNVSAIHMRALYRRFNVYEVIDRQFYLTQPPPPPPIYTKHS